MRVGIAVLVVAYGLSQFYRAFLAVLSGDLAADLGTTSADLAQASGAWFLAFALMQLPVGWALDRIGPRWTAGSLLGLGGAGGAAAFAMATGPGGVTAAMALIGIGCSPVLMASYYIFARSYPPAVFATLAGAVVGLGSLGNLAAASPMAVAVDRFGWRPSLWGLAALSLVVAVAVLGLVRDPPPAPAPDDTSGGLRGVLSTPGLWAVFALAAVNYVPAASLRGLWIGPWAADVHGADTALVGRVTLVMAVAMIVGNIVYGPLDRWLGTRKWVVAAGNGVCLAALVVLAVTPARGLWTGVALLAVVGLAGASYPVVVAHARAFFPEHLAGRGVTLANLFSIGGVGVAQAVSGPVERNAVVAGSPSASYGVLFGFFAALLAVGLAAYLFAPDRTD